MNEVKSYLDLALSPPVLNITSITHVNNTYIINIMETFPKASFVQSFLISFFTLLGDETFILLLLLKQQFPKSDLLFYAFLLSMLILNTLNVLFGRSLDLLLYQNFIDIFAIIIYSIISVKHFCRFFDRKKQMNYIEEINQVIKPQSLIDINENGINIIKNDNNSEINSQEEYIYKKYYEGHNKGYLFWIFGKTIFISLFGDAYMFAIISNSAISNFKGTILGSSIGIIIVVYLACYHGLYFGSHLSEAKMGVVISFIYFMLASEIIYFNKYLNL